MKNLFKTMMLVAVAAMGFTACSNNDVEEVLAPSKQTKKITVVSEITRTEFNNDLTKLVWSEGDTFGVFTDTDVETDLNIQSSAYAANATDFGLEVDKTATKVYAYYPYYAGNDSKTATEMSVGIPATQTQSIAGQLTKGNLPMVAQGTIEGDKVALSFRPIATVLGFNIYGDAELTEKITSISFTAINGETSNGYDYYYDLTNAEEIYEGYKAATTLNLSGDAQFVPGATKAEKPQAYMVVNKIDYSAGVEIVVTTEGGITYTFTSTQPIDCTETYRTMNLNLKNATKVVPEVVTGPYVSDSIFTYLGDDDSTNKVFSLKASKVGEEDATGFKLGTSSAVGSFTSEPVGVTGDKYLVFYGIGWTTTQGVITIKVNDTVIQTLTLNKNSSVSGNAPYLYLNFPASDFHYVQLTNLAASDKITFSTTDNGKRAVLCGVKLSDEVPALLTVTPTELSFEATGGNKTFEATLENSEDVIAVTEEADWLEVTNNGTTYTVTASPYENTEEDRTANITVTAGKLSKTITVTQAKAADPDAGGGDEVTATFAPREVTASNKTFKDDQNNSWVFTSDAKGFTSSKSYIHAGSGSKTVSHITFESNINNVTKVTVNAAAKANSSVTIKVYIGEELIGTSSVLSNTQDKGGTAFTVENTENKQGSLKIVVSRPSATKAAIYFNQAEVTYTK